MASCGTAREFKATMLLINRQLAAMNPAYKKPAWEMNSWFINNLTSAYENKVSSLSSNPKVISVENCMSFDSLTLEIIEEEDRLTNKHGPTSTTIATTMTSSTASELTLRINELQQAKNKLKCERCGKMGHSDFVGEGGCYRNPANASFKKAHWARLDERRREREGKRNGEDTGRDRSETKRRKVETEQKDFEQPTGVVRTESYGPDGWTSD